VLNDASASAWLPLLDALAQRGVEAEAWACSGSSGDPRIVAIGPARGAGSVATFGRLVAGITAQGPDLVHVCDDAVRGIGAAAARVAGVPLLVISVSDKPWAEARTGAASDLAARLSRRFPDAARRIERAVEPWRVGPQTATLNIASNHEAAAVHEEHMRVDPLRWVALEAGLGLALGGGAPDAPREADRSGRVAVCAPTEAEADSWAAEIRRVAWVSDVTVVTGSVAEGLRARRYRRVCAAVVHPGVADVGREVALAARAGAAPVAPVADPGTRWVARSDAGKLYFGARAETAAARLSDLFEAGVEPSSRRARQFAWRHLDRDAVLERVLGWYHDLLALELEPGAFASLDLSALGGAQPDAAVGRAPRDLLTGLGRR
jgi:hypothetical protein